MLTINVTENLVLKSVLSNLKASVKEDTVDARSTFKTSTDTRRCRLLAYTFLKGRTYKQVESNPRYLRAGYYGYDSSLKYEQERIIKAIAAHIPEDLGDGVSREATLQQIKFWLEMGTATRYQIIDNLEGMLAVQGLLLQVAEAQQGVVDWSAKVARVGRDMEYAKKTPGQDAKIARYAADLEYLSAGLAKATARLETASAALRDAQNKQIEAKLEKEAA